MKERDAARVNGRASSVLVAMESIRRRSGLWSAVDTVERWIRTNTMLSVCWAGSCHWADMRKLVSADPII